MTATLEHAPPAVADKPELAAFRKQDVAIAELRTKYMPLKIAGLDDKKGFEAVHAARMVVKNTRVAVEKKRKELKADALEYGRQVDTEAKRLTELLEPIESHLEAEESVVTAERERIKREAEEARRAKLRARVDALAAVGVSENVLALGEQTDEQFQKTLADATVAWKEKQAAEAERKRQEEAAAAERARIESEAAAKRKAEEEALAAERERLAAITRQQEAEAAKLAAERKRLADEDAARQRAAELEKAKAEAAEKARLDAERRHAEQVARDKAAAEAKAAQEKAEAEAAEAARIKAEAERPYWVKITALADTIDLLDVPDGPGTAAVNETLKECAKIIRDIVAEGQPKPRRPKKSQS